MNLNKFAKQVAALEGGKLNLSIAQIKEVMKHTLNLLAGCKPSEVLRLLERRTA